MTITAMEPTKLAERPHAVCRWQSSPTSECRLGSLLVGVSPSTLLGAEGLSGAP